MPLPRLALQHQHMLLLLSFLPHLLSAQDTQDPSLLSPTESDTEPIYTFLDNDDDPSSYALPPAAPTTYITTTELPGEGAGDDGHANGLLNYYFLLIAIFLVVLGIVYCTVSRKRKAKLARQHSTRQDALARDVSGWRTRWGSRGVNDESGRGGWGVLGSGRGREEEEGLDERGEAPPPYVKEPERARVREEGVFEMGRLGEGERGVGKPPPGYMARGYG